VPGVGNYIRNSVKVTIDAYDGTVTFYRADDADPIVRAYGGAFPGCSSRSTGCRSAPPSHPLPEDFFAIQARKYATYHMPILKCSTTRKTSGAAAPHDRGPRPRHGALLHDHAAPERAAGRVHPADALQSGAPRQHDRLDGRALDPPNYGRLIVFNFPKQKLVYGPRQIDARIDQDP
jgi:uncharacterized membrane protein (UPF0182 family)